MGKDDPGGLRPEKYFGDLTRSLLQAKSISKIISHANEKKDFLLGCKPFSQLEMPRPGKA